MRVHSRLVQLQRKCDLPRAVPALDQIDPLALAAFGERADLLRLTLDPATKFTIPPETSMYIPKPFKEERIEVLHDAIRRAGLATLVSMTADGLVASHVPLLLDSEPAPYGTLLGHLARPNAQARGAIGEALAIFLGPDSYITPSWYATKRETGKVVPTWNYVGVHAYGPVEFID